MRKWLRRLKVALFVLVTLLLLGAIIWLLGPRPGADTTVTFQSAAIGDDPAAYLTRTESRFNDIRAGNQKQIVWADPAVRARTPFAIVYVHGFSASAGEIRPVPDRVAAALGANLFFTRLTGHGRSDSDAMANASVNAWINDFAEAIAIGRMIGERVVVIATSTGASLAIWASTQPDFRDYIAGLVLVSPNLGPQAFGSFLLTAPFARNWVDLFIGERRSYKPLSAEQAANWTTDYPAEALIPMAVLVKMARNADVAETRIPALFIYSLKDKVVRPALTDQLVARWGGPADVFQVVSDGDPNHHVVAGDILSPGTTDAVAEKIAGWIGRL